jgi:hypothetical protein
MLIYVNSLQSTVNLIIPLARAIAITRTHPRDSYYADARAIAIPRARPLDRLA